MPEWLSDLWYEANFWASMTALTLGFSLRTEGRHHVPRTGPALVVANHQSMLDPVLVGLASRRPLTFLARKTLFRNRAFALLIRSLNAIPVDQEGIGIEGLRLILQQLEAGKAVMVFPEGNRTWDGKLQELRAGVSLLIKRAPAPVIPVGIAGAFQAWPRWRTLPVAAPLFLPAGKGTLAVSVGPPLDPRRFLHKPRAVILSELAKELQRVADRAERLRRKPRALSE